MAKSEKEINWSDVEIDYRAAVKPLRLIAEEHGITEGAIRKRAKRDLWTRDLQEKIRQEAQARIENETANKAGKAKNERQIIQVNAEIQKDIVLTHRSDIGRARKLTMQLMEELEAVTNSQELIAQLNALLNTADEDDVMNKGAEVLKKVMSLGNRSSTLKALVDSLKSLIPLEREAFGVDDKKGQQSPVDDAVKRIMNRVNE